MKRMKKLFAILMTMAMVMGLSITGFAEPVEVTDSTTPSVTKSDITVKGLSPNVATTINVYKFATLMYDADTNEYSWDIADWADDYVILNEDKTQYVIADGKENDLKSAAAMQDAVYSVPEDEEEGIMETSYTFENVPIGGYIIIPMDESAEYEPLFAVNTYDRAHSPNEEGKPEAIDIEVYAKSEDHTIVKEQGDDFAQIGQKVDYTIKATFPMSENTAGDTLTEFKITDTPTGLSIDKSTVKVTLGGQNNDITQQVSVEVNDRTGVLTVDFANILSGGHDGKDIVITYTATVTDTSYNNSVAGNSNTTDYNNGTTQGSNGSIEITKVDVESQNVLDGAEFQVYDLGVDGKWDAQNPGSLMTFVYDTNKQAYRPALSTENGNSTIKTKENEADDDGKLTIVGLDEGNYHFVETKAPNGYSINEGGLTVTVEENNTTTVKENFEDTKMAALPSTGGMGTTLFTIAGCVIMISAAGLFFATRKKAN